MNSINFFSGDKFPQYRQALAKMQDMINLVAGLAGMGGKNFILSGCEVDNNGNVSDGVIVLNGEIIPLKGAKVNIATAKITIKETRQDVNAFNVVYPETYINREAQFASNGEYNWSEFNKVPTNLELYNQVNNVVGVPVGAGLDWDGDIADIPQDYMLCDGRALLIEEYPILYKKLGIRWGGNGTTNFFLPNKGGRFSVGYTGTGDYAQVGAIGGSEYVTLLVKHLAKHKHIMPWGENPTTAWSPPWGYADGFIGNQRGSNGTDNDNAWAYSSEVGENEAHENRPPFYVEGKIIKVR